MKKKIPADAPYTEGLSRRLKDPEYAAGFLNGILEDPECPMTTFLLAVADVARAHGMKEVARRAELHRVGLHKMLNKRGNPEFRSVLSILRAIHLSILVKPMPGRHSRAA